MTPHKTAFPRIRVEETWRLGDFNDLDVGITSGRKMFRWHVQQYAGMIGTLSAVRIFYVGINCRSP